MFLNSQRESGLDIINAARKSAKRVRHSKLLADADRGRILDFSMPRHSAGALCCGIVVDAVFGTLTKELTAVRFQVADQIDALHRSRH
jgi:hypothetical protein